MNTITYMFGGNVLIKMENDLFFWSNDNGNTWAEIEERVIS